MTQFGVSGALLRGSVWVFAAEVASALVASMVGVVAAHVLSPHDFGLAGAVLLMTSVLESSTQVGFDRALIQRRGEDERLFATAWTWQAARGLLLTGALLAVTPLVARWYEEPALRNLMFLLSFAPLVRGLSNPRVVTLARKLQFERQFTLRIVHTLGSAALALGALLVLQDFWALGIRTIAEVVVASVVSFAMVPWRPRFAWDPGSARELWRYGRWITATTFMVFVITRGDDLFVSRFLGLHALGVYQMAFFVTNLPATHVAHLLAKAAFPVFASLQEDPTRLRQAFIAVLSPVLFLSCTLCALLLVGADDLVEHGLGSRWREVTPLIPVLALAGLLRSIAGTGGALFQALGRPRLEFSQNLPRFVLTTLFIWPAAVRFGLRGVCVVVLVALLPAVFIWTRALHRTLGIGPSTLLTLVRRPLFVAGLLAAALSGAKWLIPSSSLNGVLGAWTCGIGAWLVSLMAADKVLGWRSLERVSMMLAQRRSGG